MDIKVDCYCGYRSEENPKRFWIKSKKIEVREILDRWMSPDHRYFEILGDDDSIYVVRHDENSWRWELTSFKK